MIICSTVMANSPYLKDYDEHYPSAGTFESRVKYLGLMPRLELYTITRRGCKTPMKGAFVYRIGGVYFIQSFRTIVCAVCADEEVAPKGTYRFWAGSSRRTSCHISQALSEIYDQFGVRAYAYPSDAPVADFNEFMELVKERY